MSHQSCTLSRAVTEDAPPTRVPTSTAVGTAATTAATAAHKTHAAPAPAAPAGAHGTTPSLPSAPAASHDSSAPVASLPISSRSQFKTYILSNGVFEVEHRYEIREVIGQGAYGVVCSALDQKRQSFVAVKKAEGVFEHRSLAKRTLRELKLMRLFRHENILGLERVMRPHSTAFSSIYLVSELMETDLACVIRSPQELTDEHCQFFIYQVLRGLKYIHSANVIHRDLKPRNLLVNSTCDLKICDFGLARVDDPDNRDRTVMSNYIATRWYRAPEVILGRNKYTKAVDLWSAGCILAELIGRKPIFPGRDSFHQITLICSILGTPPPPPHVADGDKATAARKPPASSGPTDDYLSALPKKPKVPFSQVYPRAAPLACDLLDKLLCFDPDKRLTVEQALRHPYLAELHCEEDEPVCSPFDFSEFYFEFLKLTKDDLRVLMHEEIVSHYREETEEYRSDNATPLEHFNRTMLSNLPNGAPAPPNANAKTVPRKTRRKSF